MGGPLTFPNWASCLLADADRKAVHHLPNMSGPGPETGLRVVYLHLFYKFASGRDCARYFAPYLCRCQALCDVRDLIDAGYGIPCGDVGEVIGLPLFTECVPRAVVDHSRARWR
jgi:hypothetical protein